MRINDAVLGVLLFGLGLVIVWHASAFPESRTTDYGPGFFPMLLGGLLAAAALPLIVGGLRERGALVVLADWWRRPRRLLDVLAVPAAGFGYVLLVDRLGFTLTGLLLCGGLLALYRVRPIIAAPMAVMVALILVYTFSMLLRVPLPRGVLEPVLPGL